MPADDPMPSPDRRRVLQAVAAGAAAAALPPVALAQQPKIRLGLMLPATGTFAALGTAITNGFNLAMADQGNRLGGRDVEIVTVDDESDPAKAPDNASKLIKRDRVDVLVGTVHSGVTLAMAKVARDTNTLMVIPNAGADELTGPLCAPNIFRVSFSAWQPSYAMGQVVADRKHRNVVTLAWKYSFGEQSVAAFKESFEKAGGRIVKELYLPFPNVEFQPYLTEIATLKPDAVFVFFAGGGAVKLVKDYAAAGLKSSIPLYGPGFLTDGTLPAQGEAAQGLFTTLHYADGLDSARDAAFRAAYRKAYNVDPDVYAVQGYDAAQLLAAGFAAVKGDASQRGALVKAMQAARIDSPRGAFSLSRAHNPVQDIYLRRVDGNRNQVVGVAMKALADPARGCKL